MIHNISLSKTQTHEHSTVLYIMLQCECRHDLVQTIYENVRNIYGVIVKMHVACHSPTPPLQAFVEVSETNAYKEARVFMASWGLQ